MPHGSRQPVESPDEHGIEFVPARIGHQLIEAGAFLLSTGNFIAVFANDFVATAWGALVAGDVESPSRSLRERCRLQLCDRRLFAKVHLNS